MWTTTPTHSLKYMGFCTPENKKLNYHMKNVNYQTVPLLIALGAPLIIDSFTDYRKGVLIKVESLR